MSEVLQTNIFFFITSVGVIVLTVLVTAVLVYVLLIVRNVKDITDTLREASQTIASDMQAFRERVQGILGFILDRVLLRHPRSTRRKTAKSETEE